jgi:carboxylesterase
MADLLPGAEPFSAAGGEDGVLVVHGFTGSPQSLHGLAEAFAAAGFTVELPRLPGHGTSIEEMATTSWDDWSRAAEEAYDDLAARTRRVVVAGLSMGGTLALWLATRHPEIAGLVLVNALADATPLADARGAAQSALEQGMPFLPGIGSDIADPSAQEVAYEGVPSACLVSLIDAATELGPRLREIAMPALVFHSLQDHVVARESRELIESSLAGPVEIVELERSYHVATLDYDREEIERRSVEFARRVLAE